ncbi:hypothetical protein BGZ74_005387 [Mortierella antarctica]|nr:hypothetical protein BGZ74_005387 [Mortierella antarctica]
MLEAPAHRAAKQNSKTRALTQAKLAAAATAAAMTADRKGEVPKQKDHTNEIPNGVSHDTPPQDHDVEMNDANAQDQDEEQTHTTGTRKGIDQEDLDGGLLDGALDDVEEEEEDDDEDLGHDTEDTEVGHANERDNDNENENGFSDEDEHMNGPRADEEDKEESPIEPNDVSSHEIQEEEEEEEEEHEDNHVAKTVHQDADLEDVSVAEENDESAQVHSDDSDSEHPGAEGSEHEGEEDDDDDDGEDGEEDDDEEEDGEDEEEGSAAPEDEDDNEDEEEEEAPPPPPPPPVVKKEITLSQKPILNRPQIIEEELKDSGDDLSDLSEFDDTDDSDEDDEIAQPKTKAGSSSASGSGSTTITTSTRAAAAAAAAAVTATSVSARAAARGLGRKKSLRETSAELKHEVDKAETVEQEEEEAQKTGSRTRQGGSPKTARSKSKTAEVQQPNKGSGSEAQGEEEGVKVQGEDEEEEEAHEDEEEDLEAKQVHREALEALTSIEVEFATLRDRMYDERMLELDREVDMINLGTHPELSSLMREIHEKREQRLQIARAWRTHKGEIAQCQFEIAEYQAHCTFQASRRNTRADLTRELGHRQRTLILDLTRMTNDRKRKVMADKVVLVKARKQKRIEANNLSLISERRGFPVNSPLRMVTTTELDEDFSAMGLSRPVAATIVNIESRAQMLAQRPVGQVVPTSVTHTPAPHQHGPMSGSKWAQSQNEYSTGDEKEVEIHSDAPRCNVDGIWYKPNDAVVVLDAALGKYSAKYLYLSNDEILLQKTDGSKTRLPLNMFRSKKLYMQPRS